MFYAGEDFWSAEDEDQQRLKRRLGVMYQGGALWSSLTLGRERRAAARRVHRACAPSASPRSSRSSSRWSAWPGSRTSIRPSSRGGMRKRAGLARAMALDPEILIVDEPSSGLDPLTARRLDDLILALRDSLGTTIVVVTHEHRQHPGDRQQFRSILDPETHTMIATGNPAQALQQRRSAGATLPQPRNADMSRRARPCPDRRLRAGRARARRRHHPAAGRRRGVPANAGSRSLYFEGAAQGLQVGAPVMFLGVKIGTVKKIQLGLDEPSGAFRRAGHRSRSSPMSCTPPTASRSTCAIATTLRRLVERGLRARLRMQSLLTGQLYVDLDFHPDKPARFRSVRSGRARDSHHPDARSRNSPASSRTSRSTPSWPTWRRSASRCAA
ncbi:MAG: MlaD family protein [Comamonadaceae bacterium]|nr:MlaD family protein [Comamonadaceae bacterium]